MRKQGEGSQKSAAVAMAYNAYHWGIREPEVLLRRIVDPDDLQSALTLLRELLSCVTETTMAIVPGPEPEPAPEPKPEPGVTQGACGGWLERASV